MPYRQEFVNKHTKPIAVFLVIFSVLHGIVKPCFKIGNIQEISNYRPISLLTYFSKINEKLIYARLVTHIETNSIWVQEQYGIRTHSLTEKAAFTLINNTHFYK
jgi:hypothetical protein